jgi:hypothetical protein
MNGQDITRMPAQSQGTPTRHNNLNSPLQQQKKPSSLSPANRASYYLNISA